MTNEVPSTRVRCRPQRRVPDYPAEGAELIQRRVPDNSSAARRITPAYAGPKQATDANKLHGFKTPEAALHLGPPLHLNLDGPDTSGTERHVDLTLPHPFMLLVMKLHAFRDEYEGRKSKGVRRSALAQKHLRDAYTLVSLLTPSEERTLDQLARQSQAHAVYQETADIVRNLFKGAQSPGALMLQEVLAVDAQDLETFLSLLKDTFN